MKIGKLRRILILKKYDEKTAPMYVSEKIKLNIVTYASINKKIFVSHDKK